jgi:hypothetical protein
MEVASPLTSLRPSPGGGGGLLLLGNNKKRACSPIQCSSDIVDGITDHHVTTHHHHHHHTAAASSKRRRFHAPSEIDALSADFSSHNLFFNSNKNASASSQQKSIFVTNGGR